jgi:hypothetical protein
MIAFFVEEERYFWPEVRAKCTEKIIQDWSANPAQKMMTFKMTYQWYSFLYSLNMKQILIDHKL